MSVVLEGSNRRSGWPGDGGWSVWTDAVDTGEGISRSGKQRSYPPGGARAVGNRPDDATVKSQRQRAGYPRRSRPRTFGICHEEQMVQTSHECVEPTRIPSHNAKGIGLLDAEMRPEVLNCGAEDMDQVTEKPQSTDVWTDDLSVGVDIIDEDHQAFFRLADLLRDIMGSPDENQDMLVETAINILEEYVTGHFLREESAMAAAGYQFLAEHVAAHEAFAARTHQIAQDYKDGDKEVAATISDLVRRWLTGHIRTMDMHYRGVLTTENVDDRPMAYLTAGEDDQTDGWP